MRATEFITETFDNPYAFKWDRGDFGDYDIYVKLPDGNSLTISFNNEDKDNDVWHVAFARGHSQEITGEGDAQRIFATVLHSIKQFIGKVHPEKLYFSASKEVESGQNSESRANLYSRMVKRYASAWGYDSVVDDFGRDNVTYILNKKQPVTEEEFNGIDIDMDIEGDEIMVTATGNGRELGHVLFVDEGEYLMPQDLEVDERFQGQGIAAAMYDYVKSKGYKIRRSGQQTDAGAGFWGKHRPEQNVWENESSTPTMGINVRSDGNIDYAGLIIDGKKKYESRQTDSLRPYVGKTVAIVRTGKGPAVAIGQVTVGEPVVVDAEKFDKMRKLHLVPQGSKFDIGPGATKYLYPMINPVRWDREKLVKQKGIVARKIDESFPGKNKNKIYNLLINTIDSGPFDGGCVVFAQALQIKFGGEIMVLTGVHGADHAVLSLNGKLIDADGPAEPNEFVHRFEKNELAKITGIRPIHSKDLPDAPRSTELATQIAKLL
jgi:predicted GNAT family acetyltransferase